MTILAQILCRRHNQSWVHLTGLRPPRQPHLVRQQRHCGHRTHQPFRSDPHRSKRDSYWDLLNLFIQEKGTRQPNTSSRNVTGKEIKNLSKFFVRNLNLKIKPKHLRGADRNLKLKCTAEERFIQDRKVVYISAAGVGPLLEECGGEPDRGEAVPRHCLVLSSILHLGQRLQDPLHHLPHHSHIQLGWPG